MSEPEVGPDFASFVLARGSELRRFAVLTCGSDADGDDLLQDVLERVYPRWSRIAGSNPEGYVRAAMVNRAISRWRSPWHKRRSHGGLMAERADPTNDFATVDNRELILTGMRALPPRMRAVVVMRYWLGYSVHETADVLGCSVGSVKAQASRGLERLRPLIDPDGVGPPGTRTRPAQTTPRLDGQR